jgi:cell division protein FtsZ
MGQRSAPDDLRIVVVGCGGGGCNSITRLSRLGIKNAELLAINTDVVSLRSTPIKGRLLIGDDYTKGLGAGGDPEVGEQCAINATQALNQLFQDADLVFVLASMGGGTGTGAAPVVAECAQRNGAVVIGIVTVPFKHEGGRRRDSAIMGMRRLREVTNTMLIMENDRLTELVDNLPINQAFGVMDQLISDLIISLVSAITEPSLVNVDFADLRTIVRQGGISTILYAENADPEAVVDDAISNPLLDVDIKGGTGALIHLSAGRALTLKKANRIVEGITKNLDHDATVKMGMRVDSDQGDIIRLIAVVTGIAEMDMGDYDLGNSKVTSQVPYLRTSR